MSTSTRKLFRLPVAIPTGKGKRKTWGTVLAATGDVKVIDLHIEGAKREPVQAGMNLLRGHMLESGENAGASVRMTNGMYLVLNDKSSVAVV